MLRLLVVDDSPVARNLLVEILNGEPDMEVVGVAVNGVDAVEKVALLKPDLVTMDVQMPRMDGYAATQEIMITNPTPIVVVSGSAGKSDVEKSMLSLAAGALTVIGKPASPASDQFEQTARTLIQTVRNMAAVRVIRRHRGPPPSKHSQPPAGSTNRLPGPKVKPQLVTIAASTGGIEALQIVLGQLPADFPVPVMVVQHISLGFTDGLAKCLNDAVAPHVKVASHNEKLKPGHIYVAQEKLHCGLKSVGMIELTNSPVLGGFRPSASVLYESASRAYGSAHVAVVLTGMGSDGLEGLRSVRQSQGFVIAQSEESCVVFGMPKAAIDEGLANLILPLNEIGGQLVRITAANKEA